MATKKSTEVEILPAFAKLKKHPKVRHKSTIGFSEFLDTDGKVRKIQFEKGDKHYEKYANMSWTIHVGDNGINLNIENDPIDALKYKFVKEMIARDIYPFSSSEQLLVLVEPEVDDDTELALFDRQAIAYDIIRNDLSDPKDMRDFAHYFGLHQGSDKRVKASLIEKANEAPEEFISAWKDPLRSIIIVMKKAIDKGILMKKGETGVYFYGETPLGMNYEEIADSLHNDAGLLTVINKKVNS